MDVVSVSPLCVTSMVWQPRPAIWVLTVICRATYQLMPAESPLAGEQERPNEVDDHWNDDENRSLRAVSDFVPYKQRADVMLVGHAFAPGRAPARSVVARMIVAGVDKALEAVPDRSFTQDGQLQDGPAFTRMPLVYERAAGGPGTANPVGVRVGARDKYGRSPLPNLQPPGLNVASPNEFIEPVGFGPIAPSWPERREKLGRHAATLNLERLFQHPLPEDIDPAYFNAAPRDQQVDVVRENERIVLENLHPDHPRLATSLPGIHPRAFVDGRGGAPQILPMRVDTLWIDTDRGICTLTWRGQLSLSHPQQRGRVVVAMEQPGQTLAWDDVQPLAGGARPAETADAGPPAASTLTVAQVSKMRQTMSAVMPFAQLGERPPEERPVAAGGGLPFSPAAAPAPAHASSPPPPPAPVTPPPAAYSPWASGAPRDAAPGPSLSSSGIMQPQPTAPSMVAPLPGLDRPWSPPAPAAPPAIVAPADRASRIAHASQAALAGAAAVSDAAAAQPPPAPAQGATGTASPAIQERAAPREYIELLWFDKEAPARARAQAKWAAALEDPAKDSAWITADEAFEPKQDARDRRDVVRALSRVRPVDADGVAEALADAIDEEGVFTRPLVVVHGELSLFFEELEALKATIAVISPLVGADKKLKELADAADETAKSEWKCTSAVAEGMTARLKEAFGQQSRALPANYVETNVERILLEQRRFQKRTILGGARLRAAISPGSGPGIPTYLPEHLEKELPMFQRFRAAIVAEAHSQQDQFEGHSTALVVLALGRVSPVPGRGR